MNYTKHSDENLILLIHEGNQDATEYLLKKYSPLVKKSIRTLYLIGADTEDLSQEGMIGLFKAIQNYEPGRDATFYTYAKICIDRQIYSAIKASNRKKHSPLNSYISLYANIGEGEAELIDNLEAGNDSNPEHIVLDRENTSLFQQKLEADLSKLERDVLHQYMNGKSYADIGASLGKSAKSVDNAVQRIREKVKKIL
ncbi:MAG: sigma-70 family RNA polymerase sigma factor [Lachnospiraceae bacterium]|nr:sigma-70 family RNA polymerase sigma factor [Lachnospiraceae bacterium]